MDEQEDLEKARADLDEANMDIEYVTRPPEEEPGKIARVWFATPDNRGLVRVYDRDYEYEALRSAVDWSAKRKAAWDKHSAAAHESDSEAIGPDDTAD